MPVLKNLLQRNIATWERVLRVVVGAAVLSLTFWGPQSLWGLVGLVPLVTGLVGTCPLYAMIGFGTYRPAGAGRTQG
jgi:hypothetical protein